MKVPSKTVASTSEDSATFLCISTIISEKCLLFHPSETKILGIIFKNNTSVHFIEENWTAKIENTIKMIKQWSRRNLIIYGNILIAKTFLISQFMYIMQSIGIPEEALHKINRIIYTFIWKKKYNNKKAFEKVKRKVLCQDTSKGGLKMIDMNTLQQSLYLSWIPKIIFRRHLSTQLETISPPHPS